MGAKDQQIAKATGKSNRRKLGEHQKLLFAPMSDVGGVSGTMGREVGAAQVAVERDCAITLRVFLDLSRRGNVSGVINGRYPDREVHNLSRFLSVMKNPRPLVWRNNTRNMNSGTMGREVGAAQVAVERDCAITLRVFLDGVINGRYPDREVHNLSRFLSVMKNPRPLVWRNSHPYALAALRRRIAHSRNGASGASSRPSTCSVS
jgi:hypothetical protein